MARYDPFEEMDRMFEQLRTRVWTPEGSYGTEGRFGTDFGRFGTGFGRLGADFDMSALPAKREGMMEGTTSMASDGSVSMDLTKRDGEYVFVADLPGFEREEIDLTFDDGILTVIAESETTEEQTEGDDDEIAVRGRFARSRRVAERVTIPADVAEDDISATYRNGVLEVHFPILADFDEDDGKKIDIAD